MRSFGTQKQKVTFEDGQTVFLDVHPTRNGGMILQEHLPLDIVVHNDGSVELLFLGHVPVAYRYGIVYRIVGEMIFVTKRKVLKRSNRAKLVTKAINGQQVDAILFDGKAYVNTLYSFAYLDENGEMITFPHSISSNQFNGLPPTVDGVVYICNEFVTKVAVGQGRNDVISPDHRPYSPKGALLDIQDEAALTRGFTRFND